MIRENAKFLIAFFFMTVLAAQTITALGPPASWLALIPIGTAVIGSMLVYIVPDRKVPAKPPLAMIGDEPEWSSAAFPGRHAKTTDD